MHPDRAQVEAILGRYPRDESSLVMVLQDIQAEFRFLPCEALEQVAQELCVPRSRVFSVSTFYKVFSHEPRGRTVIQICKGTACHVRGAELIEHELCRELNLPVGGTTEDGELTIETVNCVGACALAPVVVTGDRYHADVKPSRIRRLLRDATSAAAAASAPVNGKAVAAPPRFAHPGVLLAFHDEARERAAAESAHLKVCGGPGCLAAGSRQVRDSLAKAGSTPVSLTGCQGLCQQGPLVQVAPEDVLYTHVKTADAKAISQALSAGEVVERLLGDARGRGDHPFYRGQKLQALEHCGQIDPENLEDYLAAGGFVALARAIEEGSPKSLLDAVVASGLRGRGGAGFSTERHLRPPPSRGTRPTSSATGTRGTRAPSWTAPSWRARRCRSSRG